MSPSVPQCPAVVLIEDNVAYARLVEVLLNDAFPEGVDLQHFDRLEPALAHLAVQRADCVLLDLGLPDATGMEGIAALRGAEVSASVVVLSGHSDEELALRALNAGAQDYLVKGDEQQRGVLARTIRYACERTRAQIELLAAGERLRTAFHDSSIAQALVDAGTWRFADVNNAACRLFGRTRETLLAISVADVMHPDDHAASAEGRQMMRSGAIEGRRVDRRLVRPDGTVIVAELTVSQVNDPAGEREHHLVLMRDVSDERRHAHLLRASEDRYQALTELVPVGIFQLDTQGWCTFVNARLCELTGLGAQGALGLGWLEVIHPDDRRRIIGMLSAAERFEAEARIERPDGSLRRVMVVGEPRISSDGSIERWLGCATDVTELREAQIRFGDAFAVAPLGMAISSLDRGEVQINEVFSQMLGYTQEELNAGAREKITHPDDVELDQRHVTVLIDTGAIQHWEKRFITRDGRIVWARVSASLLRDVDGTPRQLVAYVQDITENRAQALELQRQQLDMLAVAALAREAGTVDEPEATIVRGARRVLEADFACLMVEGGGLLEVIAENGLDVPVGATVRIDAGAGSGAVSSFLARERVEIGDVRDNPKLATALVEGSGARSVVFEPVLRGAEAIGVLIVGWEAVRPALSQRQATALRLLAAETAAAIERGRLMEQLRTLARSDALTGLPNRRVWDERLTLELARAARSERPACIAMLDLDGFKNFNDVNGHQAGDRLLREATAGWQELLRTSDLLVRLGGDEFGVLLPDCEPEAGAAIVDRLRSTTPGGVGCSAGVVRWNGSEDAAALVRRADEALYAAKAGRGKTVVA